MKQKINILIMLISLFAMVFGTAFNPLQQQASDISLKVTQVDTSNFPNVVVYVSAEDQYGEPVLVNPNFLVLREDGKKVPVTLIEGAEDSGPITTMLVMDVSGSMIHGSKLTMAKNVATKYVDQMRSNDLAGIIAYNTRVAEVQSVTKDREQLRAAIEGLKAEKDTAMYDAIKKAIEVLNPLPGRKAILVLTDGLDNRSKASPSDIVDSIGESGLSIGIIGLGKASQSTGSITALDEDTLTALSSKAGGDYSRATDEDSLAKIYEQYGRTLQSEYAITYQSNSTLRDGMNRRLTVTLEEGGIAGWSEAAAANVNPGGIIPETGAANTWLLFFGLLGAMIILLTLPTILRNTRKEKVQSVQQDPVSNVPKQSRVKLRS
jgi:Ca-activated chloride channel family protein